MILTVILDGISKTAVVLSDLMKVCTNPCHDRGYFNAVFVLQSCSDPLHILPGSSCDANATSDCAYHVGNMKVEEDLNRQVEEEEEEVNVKTEKGIDSEEEEGIYSEEEVEEEDIDIKEEEDAGIKEEVSLEQGFSNFFGPRHTISLCKI